MRYAESIAASAPCPSPVRPIAPPRWRISAETSGESEPGPAARTKRSIAVASSSPSIIPSPVYGTGSGGSMWSSAMPTGGTIANVSMAGPSARSGASSSAPSASVPM